MTIRSSLSAAFGLGVLGLSIAVPQGRLGHRIENVTSRQANHFGAGAGLFGFRWPADPGLNLFNARSCDRCHGTPTFGGTTRDPDLLVRMVPSSANPSGWANYQMNQELGKVVTRRSEPQGRELRRPMALYGIGYLDAVPASTLKALADPKDRDVDGISGRSLTIGKDLGRFGWRAHVPSVQQFVHDAFEVELGVAVFKPGMDEAQMDENQVRQVTTFLRLLAPPEPVRDGAGTPGERLFVQVGCAKCHLPTMKTGPSDVAGLANQTFHAYTDLLLHDMGPGKPVLDQGPSASRREFRTAPLWGIGRIGGPFWHDGSASDLTAAIAKHEGEALASKTAYQALTDAQRQALLDFLGGL